MNFISKPVILLVFVLVYFSYSSKAQILPQLKKAENGKYGYIDKSLDWIIQPSFDKAFDFDGENARVIINGKWGLIDQKGKFTVKADYKYIGWSNDPYFKLNCKNLGLTNTLLPPPPFFNANEEGYLAALEGDKWGLVQSGGKILKFEWDSIFTMNGGHASVYKKNKGWTWIDEKGNAPKEKYFEKVNALKNGLIAAKIDSLWYAYNSKGTLLNVNGYDAIESLNEQTVKFTINDKMGTMNSDGEIIKAPIYENIKYVSWIRTLQYKPYTPFLVENLSQKVLDTLDFKVLRQFDNHLFLVSQKNKYKLWNSQKKQMTSAPEFDDIRRIGHFLLFYQKNAFRLFDVNQGEFFEDSFVNIHQVGEYYLIQNTDYKWMVFRNGGFITGEFERYEFLPIANYVALQNNGRWLIFNDQGQPSIELGEALKLNEVSKNILLIEKADQLALTRLDSNQVQYFGKSEYLILSGGFWALKTNGIWQIHDSLGKKVIHQPAEIVKNFESGQFRLISDGKWFLISSSGKKVLNGSYDFIGDLRSGFRVVVNDEKHGIINENGHFTYQMEKKFDDISEFDIKWATVKYKGLVGKIDANGIFKIAPHYDAFGKMTSKLIEFKFRNQWGVLDHRENIVVQPIYDKVKILNDDFIQVWKNGLTGLINDKNELRIKLEYDSLQQNDFEFYLVYKSDKVGIYDPDGNQIRAAYFDEVKQLDETLFALRKGEFWQVIDREGKSIMDNRLEAVFYNKRLQQFILKENRDWIIEKITD